MPVELRASELLPKSMLSGDGYTVNERVINLGVQSRVAAMKSLLRDNPPVTLAKINKDKLVAMGIKEHQAEALLKNYNYTPTEMTLMVESLHRMGDIRGREMTEKVSFTEG